MPAHTPTTGRTPNRLIHESSPYLRQHAFNPVDWYPWGDEAQQRARRDDRPILLSVGYSACHWCHVMERESFENPAIAALMNEHFVNIKVDREERPDIDSMYMDAVQAMTGSGGWPMTVFLTPNGIPFYGGTYFPPTDRHGLPGFPTVLQAIARAYSTQRSAVESNAEALRARLQRPIVLDSSGPIAPPLLERTTQRLLGMADRQQGGLQGAPKFPQPALWDYLLRRAVQTGVAEPLAVVERTLQAMANGGIWDHLGGGFHRYSTDASWLVPHFEKMLYDNAQLALLYLHAYQVTGKEAYRDIVDDILAYVLREMTSADGGFYATQDADSEGAEGRFFVWSVEEITRVLPESDARLALAFYGITTLGNFEGSTILTSARPLAEVAAALGMSSLEARTVLRRIRATLLAVRAQRVPPLCDSKILTSWNGLMMRAFAEAGRVLGQPTYVEVALRNAHFLLSTLRQPTEGTAQRTTRLFHVYKDGTARINGYLEDYAFLADGMLALYEATFDEQWFTMAGTLAQSMMAHFWDADGGGFFTTSDDHEALLTRPKDLLDNATPAGNSVACAVLLRLGALTGHEPDTATALRVLSGLAPSMEEHPAAFGRLLSVAADALAAPCEVAIVGDPTLAVVQDMLAVVGRHYHPHMVVALAKHPVAPAAQVIPLLAHRPLQNGRPSAYVCQNFACRAPVHTADDLRRLLDAQRMGGPTAPEQG